VVVRTDKKRFYYHVIFGGYAAASTIPARENSGMLKVVLPDGNDTAALMLLVNGCIGYLPVE
jgi:hypothetical protein